MTSIPLPFHINRTYNVAHAAHYFLIYYWRTPISNDLPSVISRCHLLLCKIVPTLVFADVCNHFGNTCSQQTYSYYVPLCLRVFPLRSHGLGLYVITCHERVHLAQWAHSKLYFTNIIAYCSFPLNLVYDTNLCMSSCVSRRPIIAAHHSWLL